MHHSRQFHHTLSKNGPNVHVVTHLSHQTFQSLDFNNLSGTASSRNDLDMGSCTPTLGDSWLLGAF